MAWTPVDGHWLRRTMKRIVIVTPALAGANNGNWQTASRWRRFIAASLPARVVSGWPDAGAEGDTAMIALHARRSAASIAAWHARHGGDRLAVVLTGTDLYRDIATDHDAQRSLRFAQRLVVLQECGPLALPESLRLRARVIFQSAGTRRTLNKSPSRLRVLAVGHLRAEKAPETLLDAARRLADAPQIRVDQIGTALDPALGAAAETAMAELPNYRWLGGLPHEETRRRIQRAHLLAHCSRIEGGAHAILEAVVSGTPVLASRIEGNVGMLGADYEGYFPPGDGAALATLIRQCDESRRWRDGGLLARLAAQCAARAPLFAPAAEAAAVRRLAGELLVAPATVCR